MTVEALIPLAKSKRAMIATAESCTAGLIAGAITEIAGASEVFDRGFVTYSNAAKADMLGVLPTTLEAHGAVSKAVAQQMAEGALARSKANITVAVTGIAGPGGSEHKPEGRVCFAVATAKRSFVETIDFGALGRSAVRAKTVEHAVDLLISILNDF